MEEGKQNNTFTCSGLTPTVSVYWFLDNNTDLGSCTTDLNSSCKSGLYPLALSIKRTANISTMTVNETEINNKGLLKKGSLLCVTFTENSIKFEETRCQLDLISKLLWIENLHHVTRKSF